MPPQPQSPDPQFDFMLKNQPTQGHGYFWSNFHGRTKTTLAIIAGVFLLIIFIALLSSHGRGASQPLINVRARGQETLRVTQEVQQLGLQDPATRALAATVTNSLSSDQAQLKTYMAASKFKISVAQLAADTDKTTDTQMQSALQNNNLDQAYVTYLRQFLAKYLVDLQSAYNAVGPNGKIILKGSLDSTETILANPPLRN